MLYKEQMGLAKDDQEQEYPEQNRSPSENRKLLSNLQELGGKRESERVSCKYLSRIRFYGSYKEVFFKYNHHAR
jgi:hypothetical protein